MVPKLCGLQLKTSALRKACLCDYYRICNVAYLETMFGIWTCLSFALHSVLYCLSASSVDMLLDHQELYSPLGDNLREKVRETLLKRHHHQNQKKLANRLPIVRSIADIGRRTSELHLDKNGEKTDDCDERGRAPFLDTSEGYRIQLKGYEMMNRIPCSWYDRWLTSTIKWETRMSQLLNFHEFLGKKPKTFTVSKRWPPVTLMTFSSRSSADSEHISASGHTVMALSSSNLLLFHHPPARILQVRWHRPSRI